MQEKVKCAIALKAEEVNYQLYLGFTQVNPETVFFRYSGFTDQGSYLLWAMGIRPLPPTDRVLSTSLPKSCLY